MVKIDGKLGMMWYGLVLSVLSYLSCFGSTKLELDVKDMDSNPIRTIAVGQPFLVSVTIPETVNNPIEPVIHTNPSVSLVWSGKKMVIKGNKVVVQYIYRGRIDAAGDYLIGPAAIDYQATKITSPVVTIRVDATATGANTSAKGEPRVTMSVPIDRAVVGQSVPVTLTFYYTDKSTRVVAVLQPQSHDFVVHGDEQGTVGTQELEGVMYHFMRWEIAVTLSKTGSVVIPAYCVNYEVEKRSQSRLGGFGFFFGSSYQTKRAYSNALTIAVDQLPVHKGPVLAVGTFEAIKMSVDPSTIAQGEAMVLAIDITGNTNFDQMQIPQLKQIPDGLRYYDSKNYLLDTSAGVTAKNTKRFEYVMQGLREGKWHIPAQEFTVFDTAKRAYKTMRTNGVSITVHQNSTRAQPDQTEQVRTKETQEKIEKQEPSVGASAISDKMTLWRHGPWSALSPRAPLSDWLFWLLLLIPLLVMICAGGGAWPVERIRRLRSNRHANTVFSRTRLLISKASDKNDIRAVYYHMVQLFADKYQVNPAAVSQLFIEEKLKHAQFSPNLLVEWQKFFTLLSAAVFGASHERTSSVLFTQAQQWVDILEKYL